MSNFKSLIDTAIDIVEAAINRGQEVSEEARIEQWTEEGSEAGKADAERDYASGNWRTNVIVEVETPADPGIAPGSTFDAIELPSFVNPLLTAAEIAFTPSELNVAEFAQRDAFQAGDNDAYRTGMFNAFDQALEDRFAPPPSDPAPESPSALDCLVPPLDAPPAMDWSDCDSTLSNADLGSTSTSWTSNSNSGTSSYDTGGSSGDSGSGGGPDSGSSD